VQASLRCLALALLVTACAPSAPPTSGGAPGAGSNLSAAQRAAIGRKIWQNESGGKVDGLTHWNVGEEFPSLGIGHAIWYPAGFNGRFFETWPAFVSFATQRGAAVPAVGRKPDCPWPSRDAFYRDFKGAEMTGLRKWLAANVTIQTDFIISRSRGALGKVLAAAPAGDRARVEANYRKVSTTSNGTYALIDYVNFKGDGTNTSERYNGQGWGLLQVLQEMRDVPSGQPAAKEFAAAAKRRLDLRLKNSPPGRGESRWRSGWHNRCDTYARPL